MLLWNKLKSILQLVFVLFGFFVFFYALIGPFVSVDTDYLGYYPNDNVTVVGSQEWKDWHEDKFANSRCANKEILNTIDVCGGHVTTFCKKHWSYAYNWCEIHCMNNQCYWQWWFE